MKPFDLTPLYRTAIGVDRLADLFDDALRTSQTGYPPYDVGLVEKDKYRITMAVAGFDRSEISIESENDTLKVVGRKNKEQGKHTYLHRGIAARDFEQRFRLADHVKAVGATMDNGLLSVELVREIPEAMKPRKIAIESGTMGIAESKAAPQVETSADRNDAQAA